MENIYYPFPLPIYKKVVENILFNKIKQEVLEFINKNPKKFTVPYNWNCNTLSTIHIDRENNFQSKILKKVIKNSANEYFSIWKYTSNLKLNLNNVWINISPPNSYQEMHDHYPHSFSGTLYIEYPNNGGNLYLQNPMTSESFLMGNNQKLLNSHNMIIPKNGLIVIFPSWLNHSVLPNKSNKNRISISFNIDKL